MFFLNFGIAQFLMVAGALSAFTVALYLLDRSRRRQVVSTLRFWTQARQPVQSSRRRHIQQPVSLLLQLLGILLLLLAIAQPRFGNPFARPGYHVLLLETSAWMGARSGGGTLMDVARKRAAQWLATVPAHDRVMLIRADALATPATAFESDHSRVAAAITASVPGATSLDIDEALSFAQRAQALQSAGGEVVFIGTGRIRERQDAGPAAPATAGSALRVILIPDAIANTGLRRISMKRSATDPALWEILVAVRNYGTRPRAVNLTVAYDRAPIGSSRMVLAPGADQEATFSCQSRRAGLLEAQLAPGDAFSDDDRAAMLAPGLPELPVVVYTTRPDVLRPLLAANTRVEAQYRAPAQYRAQDPAAEKGLVILDRFRPPTPPRGNTIWIDTPPSQSPVPVLKTVQKPHGLRWIGNHALGQGLRAHDARLGSASVLQAAEGDLKVAEIDDGPVILARPGPRKMVVVGFDPEEAGMRYDLSTPLLFANILRWIDPETFRQSDLSVQSAGTVTATLDNDVTPGQLRVTREDGSAIPFTLDHRSLHFFSGSRESVRVTDQDRESVYSLSLPEMWDTRWQPPATASRGIPRTGALVAAQSDIWPWLACLGAACFIAEWFLASRARRVRVKAMPVRAPLRRAS